MSFRETNTFFTVIIIGVSLNAFMTYPVQILCVFDTMEKATFFENHRKVKSILARSVVICAITGIALVIPNFTDFLNLAGGFGAGLVSLILPPLFYNMALGDSITRREYWLNWGLVVFGVVGSTMSIYTSFQSIKEAT